MNEQESVRKALSVLHASENTLEEVMKMANQNHHVGTRRAGKSLLITAALAALCVTTAFAADYVINHREILFFDTLEARRLRTNHQ